MHIPWGISFYDFHPWGHYLLVKCLDVEQSASMARNAALSEQNVSSENPCWAERLSWEILQ